MITALSAAKADSSFSAPLEEIRQGVERDFNFTSVHPQRALAGVKEGSTVLAQLNQAGFVRFRRRLVLESRVPFKAPVHNDAFVRTWRAPADRAVKVVLGMAMLDRKGQEMVDFIFKIVGAQ